MGLPSLKPRVLLLEDTLADAEMILHELRRSGIDLEWKRVETESDFLDALEPPPDLILADYRLPGFDGLSALRLIKQRGLDIPFIIVSGTVGEDLAVAAIIEGATDYVLKDRLARLGIAVQRAFDEQRLRRERRQADERLREGEARLRGLLEAAPDTVLLLNMSGEIVFANEKAGEVFGYGPGEMLGRNVEALIPERFRDQHREHLANSSTTPTIRAMGTGMDLPARRRDGSEFPADIMLSSLRVDDQVHVMAIVRDLTQLKQSEASLNERVLLSRLSAEVATALTTGETLRDMLRPCAESMVRNLHAPAPGVQPQAGAQARSAESQ
ncbi:MAG: PAS domain S-box protein [Acidobacteria bacterium]|nr:PAS domain S-box protein [Acidobacteriota bacterium]